MLDVWEVSDKLRVYVRRHMGCHIRAREAGGGGDCLFHSCAAVLERMRCADDFSARQHVRSVFSTPTLQQNFESKVRMVQCLRNFSAEQFETWSPETFFDYLLRAAVDKQLGEFEDAWNPEWMMREYGFGCLIDNSGALAESVLACEEQENGDAKLRVAFTVAEPGAAAREERVVSVPDGRENYKDLLRAVQQQYRKSGNWHWGTQCDVRHLSSKLNVGILMFCDGLQHNGAQCLYNISAQREDFPFWIALWWKEATHYRLAELRHEEDQSSVHKHQYVSFWSAEDLPEELLQEYKRCNRLAN